MTDSYVFQAGLFGQMQDNPDTPLPRPEELFPKLEHPECLVLSLLRCAQRHPLVSDEFTLLLLERLQGVEIHASDEGREPGQPRCTLTLQLVGTGSAATVMQRHLDDLRFLVSGLLSNRCVFPREWDADHACWHCREGHRLQAVALEVPAGQGVWLSWPELSFIGGGASCRDQEPQTNAVG
jgi:hypothetical protein